MPASSPGSVLGRALARVGPGILLAGAAIGVSHLVQSTRAGADYRFGMLGLLALACLTKYPFLEFGPRYAAATGEDLVQGYRRLGMWAVWTTLLVTVGSMFVVMAAVTIVTAALAKHLLEMALPVEWSVATWSAVIVAGCMALLLVGRYALLERTMKLVMALLLVSTIAAVVVALADPATHRDVPPAPSWFTPAGYAFALAFMGWMPIPLDSAIWHSIWVQEHGAKSGRAMTGREARFDFDFGYVLAGLVGVLFVALGALVMFGTGETFAAGGGGFAGQFIDMYGRTLGRWSIPIIGVAALTTMFSTTLVVLDAFPRVMQRLVSTVRGSTPGPRAAGRAYAAWVVVLGGTALAILGFLARGLTALVDFATTLSFLTAPVFAVINHLVVTGPHMPAHARPGRAMRALSLGSIVFLVAFSAAYLVWRATR